MPMQRDGCRQVSRLHIDCHTSSLQTTAIILYAKRLPLSDEPVRIPITDVFDLHSVPPRDVKGVVEAYLEEAHKRGFRALRIIHGRGIGVQREIVRRVLEKADFVESYGDAPAEAGGWGATIVNLRGR